MAAKLDTITVRVWTMSMRGGGVYSPIFNYFIDIFFFLLIIIQLNIVFIFIFYI